MAVTKELVVDKLKALKTSGINISDKLISNLADRWAPIIADDAAADGFIELRKDVLEETVAEADRRVTQAAQKQKPAEPAKPNETPPAAEQVPPSTDPAIAALTKQISDLAGVVTGMVQGQQAQTMAQRFGTDPRLAGIPEAFFKGRVPRTEEEFEIAVTDTAADFKAIKQSFAGEAGNAGSGTPATPPVGTQKAPVVATQEKMDRISL